MRRILSLAAVGVTAASIISASPVHAATSTDCSSTIVALQQATLDATSLSDRSEAGLLTKADAAGDKLSEDKITDSLMKVDDYQAMLDALAADRKSKVSETDYLTLTDARQQASDCLTTLLAAAT
jgi:hypothetical protein